MSTNVPKIIQEYIQNVSDQLDADLLLYSADINEDNADTLIEIVREKPSKRENVVLILATYGGDPDAAYRITRFLKQTYSNFTLFVFGYCKSAGTLIAIGADEIVMSDLAELGPLDVQVLKENDFRRSSGLDLQQALSVLGGELFSVFEGCFLSMIYKSGGVITTKMAADIASSMAIGLMEPVAGQIDPLRLGELSRSMNVAYEYGIRLNEDLNNSIKKLVAGYPSHSFVIDREEAKELFNNVREPTELELALEVILKECARTPAPKEMIFSLEVFLKMDAEDEELEDSEDGEKNEQPTNDVPSKDGNVETGNPEPEGENQCTDEEEPGIEKNQSLYAG